MCTGDANFTATTRREQTNKECPHSQTSREHLKSQASVNSCLKKEKKFEGILTFFLNRRELIDGYKGLKASFIKE